MHNIKWRVAKAAYQRSSMWSENSSGAGGSKRNIKQRIKSVVKLA